MSKDKKERETLKRSSWSEKLALTTVLMAATGIVGFYGYLSLGATLASPTDLTSILTPTPVIAEETRYVLEDKTTVTYFSDRAEQSLVGGIVEETVSEQTQPQDLTPPTQAAQTATANSSLNVRSLPSTEGELIGSLIAGEVIQVEAITSQYDGDWVKFTYSSKEAYVKAEFVSLNNN